MSDCCYVVKKNKIHFTGSVQPALIRKSDFEDKNYRVFIFPKKINVPDVFQPVCQFPLEDTRIEFNAYDYAYAFRSSGDNYSNYELIFRNSYNKNITIGNDFIDEKMNGKIHISILRLGKIYDLKNLSIKRNAVIDTLELPETYDLKQLIFLDERVKSVSLYNKYEKQPKRLSDMELQFYRYNSTNKPIASKVKNKITGLVIHYNKNSGYHTLFGLLPVIYNIIVFLIGVIFVSKK